MKISILDIDYEINDIRQVSSNIIKISFKDMLPTAFGSITTYTNGGIKAGEIFGYSTLYKLDGKDIYLSNDGSYYNKTSDIVISPGTKPETVDEAKKIKKESVSATCQQLIYAGIDVVLSDETTEHFSLTEKDQINLFGKQLQISSGKKIIEYHADGKPCKYYSSEDIQRIIEASMKYVSYHTTYCNSMYMWIEGCSEIEELDNISYGVDIPEEYRTDVLKSYLTEVE